MTLFSSLTILGLVIGSGFVSGREILTFFTRFGFWSIPCTFLSGFIFYFLIKFLLNLGENGLKNTKNSIFFAIINLIMSIVFSSAMFSGIVELTSFDSKTLTFLLFAIVLFLCFLIYKNGLGMLNKLNLFLVPVMIVFLILGSYILLRSSNFAFSYDKFNFTSLSYMIFYCILNTSSGCIVIMTLGGKLSSKQKARVALISSLVLSSLLVLTNLVLLLNPSSFSYDMPFLSLFSGTIKVIMNAIVLLGALTSIFSLVYSSSSLLRGLKINELVVFLVSIIVPLMISLLGFKVIVSYLYPIVSAFSSLIFLKLYFNRKREFK